ncbi:6-hydroxymethylpterin diphosphokinase MptE-like protein [Colwellia sp. RSH04]|uniref:motility associated factor glycosyltransferase family protein n=1 Tax=Colwellia sp. RSH04 TaxID=2305464 RepID=UPI002174FA92|nr:6-hydroxymethylpterin diphosphokinase MptE-like protein [Colwellia sp. RSH04]
MDSLEKNLRDVEDKLEKLQDKIALEEAFTEKANVRYEQNLRAFEKYFPDIYQRFIAYNPKQDFQLDVNPDGTANILDYDTQVPMYSQTPVEQVNAQVKETLANPELSRVDLSSVEFIEDTADFLHVRIMNKVGKVYNKAKDELEENLLVDKAIPSKVIFGIGLGYHLQPLLEATKASYITIFEPNEDYFFASLFSFDWDAYLKQVDDDGSYLYIGIGDSEEDMYQTLYQRAKNIGAFSVSNSFFYLHYKSRSVANLISKIKNNFHQFFMGWGFFDDALMSVAHSIGVAEKNPNMLDLSVKLPKSIEQFPIFIVANGPSLDKDIEFIKAHQDKVIVVACNSASTALLARGIYPDFHVALERTKQTYDFLETIISEEDRQKINLLVLNVMYPEVLDLFGWSGVALKGSEPGTMLFQLGIFLQSKTLMPTIGYSNPLVGNTALSFFAHLGFLDIYLFGVDNGYVDETHHHSKASFYYDDKGNSKLDSIKMGAEFEVEGNFGQTVITEPFLFTGKEQMDRLINSFSGTNLQCYNCSDGARIEGAIPVRSSDIILGNDAATKEQVINFVKENSFKKPNLEASLADLLSFDVFEQICNTMIEILEQPINDREDALKNIIDHLRYLMSFRTGEEYLHLYLILEGEALYINSVLISLLFNFGDDKNIIPYFKEALEHWISFLKVAPEQYRERWNTLSDHNFIFEK